MESDLPWIPGPVMDLLEGDTAFMQACHDRISGRAPDDITLPYATVQVPAPLADLGGGRYRGLIDVHGWCAQEWTDEDPALVVWRIADRARRVLRQARNANHLTMWFTITPIEVGSLPPDITRGESSPIQHAVMRGRVAVHNR